MSKRQNLKLNVRGIQESGEDTKKSSGRKPIRLHTQGKPDARLFAESEVSHQIFQEIRERREAKKRCTEAQNQETTRVVKPLS